MRKILLAIALISFCSWGSTTEERRGAEASSLALFAPATESAELGRVASGAALCGLDPEPLVARQIGLQLSAGLWEASSPEQILSYLASFSLARSDFSGEYAKADDALKSRMCAFSWLGWRSMRGASSLTTAKPNLVEAMALSRQTGTIHGWAWSCESKGLSIADLPSLISKQSAASLALAALSSSSIDDLIQTHQAWAQGFAAALGDARIKNEDCSDVEKSLPVLSEAFERSSRLERELSEARAAKASLSGQGS